MRITGILCTLVCFFAASSHGYKILGIFNSMGRSHHIVGSALMKGLATHGHEVTIIAPFPEKKPIKNYREVINGEVMEATKDIMTGFLDRRGMSIFEMLQDFFGMGILITNTTLASKNVQDLLNSDEKFDLIILEVFVNEALIGFAHRFNAPVVAMSTFGASLFTTELVGTPSPPSYVPNPFLAFTDRMSLPERIGNIVVNGFQELYSVYSYLPRQEELYNMYFSDPKPSFYELRKNVSLVLLNTHFTLGYPRPYVPNMIEVGGLQVNRKTKPLPSDIQAFLDSAKDGAIYFSMGSNFKSLLFPEEKRNMFLNVFNSLKQKVLWKWENKTLPGKSDNVFISDWFPQDDILAHPNLKLFITHGGLLSTTESIYHGVPVVGIPMFGDQFLNMARAEKAGYGISLTFEEMDETKLKAAINEIFSNEKYAKNMKEISERYRDQPVDPLKNAIYWVEYVIRHKGAPHMHSAGQELSFIQYHNLDAFAILIGGTLFVIYLICLLIKKIVCSICGIGKKSATKTQKKKQKSN